ncbi:acyl-CoA dehydrogenase family protein [Halobacillus sp. BBL2006]|uniref:acyl-CoA dehydrogenase family protein n=1 Tax=Halobacillus sp. BBL2006 TaxID=1543706 RepID=UPI0005426968|nr:acyl-CoA dehydrogenase family protein [Halobacillus sp. BBL2006]KHE71906.1 isovaleryl-CoA dehydrogenase [Halobacillus sp. BBL2006]
MNFYENDPVLQDIMEQKFDQSFWPWAHEQLHRFGEMCANEIDERAVHTDREGQPKLIKYNKMGEDISEVWLNEGYKQTIADTYGEGIVGYLHKPIPELGRRGNYLYSYAQGYLLSQSEPGFYCPVTLTMATAYLIEHYADEELKAAYLPHVASTGETELYEGATFLTERQGGSDVGANEVKAVSEDSCYQLYGEKYFASNAGACGVAMVLARIEGSPKGTKGLSLFLVPWRHEDETLNGIQIRRLKDKLGVRAVPSAEVEFNGAKAYLVGKADQGFYYMMEALNLSRVCNAVASIGIMRRAYTEAYTYAQQRKAFGQSLIQYPMIKDSLVKMCVKQEVEMRTVFDMIGFFDEAAREPEKEGDATRVMNRLRIAIMKKETAEQAVHFAHESLEMHGGNGYIEDFVTPRLLRDAQVLTVWEGTANILGLEVLRLLHKFGAHEHFFEEMNQRLSSVHVLSKEVGIVKSELKILTAWIGEVLQKGSDVQTFYSKKIAERMAVLYEAVVALEAGGKSTRNQKVAELYVHNSYSEEEPMDSPKSLQYSEEILRFNKVLH